MRIAIADDHSIVRKGIQLIIDENFEDAKLDEANNGDELVELIKNNQYDIIILDISMPGKDVIDTIRMIRSMKSKIPILIFSMNPEKAYAIRMLKAGANGYINKDCTQEDLVEAIEKVSQGKGYITQSLSEILATEIRDGVGKPLHEILSDREFQVMLLIAEGHTLDEIAGKLYLSKNTVSNHRNSIMKKLNLRNNSEITIYALKNNLIS